MLLVKQSSHWRLIGDFQFDVVFGLATDSGFRITKRYIYTSGCIYIGSILSSV